MDINIIIGAVLLGLLIGSLTGIFGVGGGFLMTPALMVLLNISGDVAVGTGLATILVTSTIGLFYRRNTGTIDVKLAMVIAGGSIIGVGLGSYIMDLLKQISNIVIFSKEVDALQFILLCLFLVLLGLISGYLTYDYLRNGGRSPSKRIGLFSTFKIPPYMHFSSLEQPQLSILPLGALGLSVGVLTGLLGTGGGVLLLPLLVYMVGQRTIKAAGTSLLLVWIASLAAVVLKGQAGQINYILLAALLTGALSGTYFGTRIGLRLAGPKIRIYFVFVVLAAMLMVAARLYTIFL